MDEPNQNTNPIIPANSPVSSDPAVDLTSLPEPLPVNPADQPITPPISPDNPIPPNPSVSSENSVLSVLPNSDPSVSSVLPTLDPLKPPEDFKPSNTSEPSELPKHDPINASDPSVLSDPSSSSVLPPSDQPKTPIDSGTSEPSNPTTLPVNNNLPPLKISADNPFIKNVNNKDNSDPEKVNSDIPNPSAPSVDSVPSVLPNSNATFVPTPNDNLNYASVIRRFFAALLDGFVFGLLLTLFSFPFIYYFKLDSLLAQTNPQEIQKLIEPYSVFISSGLYLLISISSALFISLWGGTPGKIIFKLKVVTLDGEKASFGRALLREMVGKWISSLAFDIGYLWALWDSKHQTWHDKIANTVVIKV